MQPMPFGQRQHDLLEFLFAGRTEVNSHAETVYQGKFFLDCIIGVQVVIPVRFVAEFLTYQMTARLEVA